VFSIVITERGGAQRLLEVDAAEAGIGRLEDNEIVLPRSNVSKHHARLVVKDDRCVIVDLKSTNGTYVNGRKISAPMVVGPTDKIYIGDFILSLQQSSNVTGERRLRSDSGDAETRSMPHEPGRPFSQRPPAPEPMHEPGLGAPAVPLESLGKRPLPPPRGGLPQPVRSPALSPLPPPAGPTQVHGGSDGYVGPTVRPQEPPPDELPIEDVSFRDSEPTTGEVLRLDDDAASSAVRSTPSARPPRQVQLTGPAAIPESSPPYVPAAQTSTSSGKVRSPSIPPRVQNPEQAGGPATSPAVLSPSVRLQGALSTLMERLAGRMDTTAPLERAFPSEHQRTLDGLMDELGQDGVIGPDLDRRFLTQAAVSEAVGLGPLDRLLSNRAVREVVVDGPARILADLGGGLNAVSSFFSSNAAVIVAGRRLLARGGKDLTNEAVQTAQLPDGLQVQILLPPLSPHGALLSVRCPPRAPQAADGLVTEGMLSLEMLALLRKGMQKKLNFLVAGPMGTGVSTMLGALGSLCPDHERLLALQDGPSLPIDHLHVLPLHRSALPGDSFAELLRIGTRLRPDRVLIDDVRGEDALQILMGAAAARGMLVGMHAPSAIAALEQIEILAQISLGGARSSLAALLAQAFHILVHVSMDEGGARRVVAIDEIRGARENTVEVTPLFRYDQGFKATENKPSFL
jgi:pilus assembly protein CpaF